MNSRLKEAIYRCGLSLDCAEKATVEVKTKNLSCILNQLEELEANNIKLNAGILAINGLIRNSFGVTGLHLNGDIAPWDDLRLGGEYEVWLRDFDIAFKNYSNNQPQQIIAYKAKNDVLITRLEQEIKQLKKINTKLHIDIIEIKWVDTIPTIRGAYWMRSNQHKAQIIELHAIDGRLGFASEGGHYWADEWTDAFAKCQWSSEKINEPDNI